MIKGDIDNRIVSGDDKEWLKGQDLSKVEDCERDKPPVIHDQMDNFKFM